MCGWHNCEANIRGSSPLSGAPVPRADWGYGTSLLAECENGPQGDTWRALGACSNPRLDIDNNLSEGTGVPENINVDRPRDGETFRIMVQNFSGTRARPLVNVYCAGRRVATLGAPPDEGPPFEAARAGHRGPGPLSPRSRAPATAVAAGRPGDVVADELAEVTLAGHEADEGDGPVGRLGLDQSGQLGRLPLDEVEVHRPSRQPQDQLVQEQQEGVVD